MGLDGQEVVDEDATACLRRQLEQVGARRATRVAAAEDTVGREGGVAVDVTVLDGGDGADTQRVALAVSARADGVDVRTLDLPSWRSRVAAVFQDFIRFELSMRDNVAPGGARTSTAFS